MPFAWVLLGVVCLVALTLAFYLGYRTGYARRPPRLPLEPQPQPKIHPSEEDTIVLPVPSEPSSRPKQAADSPAARRDGADYQAYLELPYHLD